MCTGPKITVGTIPPVVLLAVACFMVPVAEAVVIVEVSHRIGALRTVGLLVAVSAFGCLLVKRAGIGVARRFRQRLRSGRIPGAATVDGVLVLGAGVMLATPGFLTDAVGLLLVFPPVRRVVRRTFRRRMARRVRPRVLLGSL